ncbi:hypothetical protein [Sinorhizobium meliloti]|uniref:hypothetical protein n=1 Tax=Rhizobium meliloti TaxID=382 RepID=UPI001F3BD66E|nr:hypothetical protein [Sinorhizobium meliloti]
MEEGALVAFNSAVDAVECAISLQEELARDQEELPSGERIVLRIGINLADVVIEGDDLLGTASTSLLASRHRPSREGYASPMPCIASLAESAGPPSWTEARYPSRISPDPFTSGIQVYANSRAVDVFGIGADIDCGVAVRESLQLAGSDFFQRRHH